MLVAILVGAAAAGATAFGGVLALRFRSALGPLLSFSSGVVLGVALLDLFPEALALNAPPSSPSVASTAMLLGLFLYLAIDRLASSPAAGGMRPASPIGPASLVLHSLLDGFGIGCAFQASAPVGLVVAAGVLAHDVVDGANTVVLALNRGASPRAARRWLMLDGAAPMAGILLANAVRAPPAILAAILATMAGGFIYIGASDLIPQTRSNAPLQAITLTGAGLGFVFLVVRLSASLGSI